MNAVRFAVAAALMAATALFLHGRREIIAARPPLSSFPQQLGGWSGTDVPIPQEVREVLGPGDFLLRVYDKPAEPWVDLFVAYFPTQSTGDTIHSPRNCLPGAGWSPVESSRIMLALPNRAPFPVNRYVVAKGDERQLVLYWYWAHDRAVASEYWAKFYLVADSIRLNRSDGALIRVTTPLTSDESESTAEQRLMGVVGEMVSRLDGYLPR